ncbi:hypothetical protein FJ987_25325 [Mesorhizobium sp. CU2]|uniref:hypothetical protein n=1 Tax=unclassified Mesorhizobium TaxID=325217 RepID=UPI00112EC836|nr:MULTISPECIES: hypothetical protein [unclassified Mesorhizobium]TPN81963.1 hypothetical protein FJ988_17380 [Mesorhizobium sp. CU3]TPO06340.1 hypothetical protein FJ987_25325 [Mesorhizobium sp. CU2]
MDKFFEVSLPVQIALGGGYLGYLVAYVGIRKEHQQVDTVFLTVAFGIVATLAAKYLSPYLPTNVSIVVAVLAPVVAALIWRKFGRPLVRKVYRETQVSYADDDATVWTTLAADTSHEITQVSAVLKDGRELFCDNTERFAAAAFAPFMVAPDGAVTMYVTHTYRRDKTGKATATAHADTHDDYWGDNMTVIPADSIHTLDIRFRKKA